MSQREFQQSSPRRSEEEDVPAPVASSEHAERAQGIGDDLDDVLDEIDSVLESNAEEFVSGFVQKGGQ